MVCQGIEDFTINNISGLMSYPTSCVPQYWAVIYGALFIIIAIILYRNDQNKTIGKPDMISALGVSGIVTILLALAGSLVGFLSEIVFIEIFAGCLVFVILWVFTK